MPILRVALALIALTIVVCGQGPSIACVKDDGKVTVTVDDKPFTAYRFGGLKRPCVWPVIGPGQRRVTRVYPLGDAHEGEARDHPHHTGIWFGHGNVNGLDFWHPQDKKRGGKVEIVKWIEDPAKTGRVKVRQRWTDPKGKRVAEDETTLSFGADATARWIDWTVTVFATDEPLRFGDTKEGTLGARMHPALRLEGKVAKGSVVTSAGKTGKGVWGKRAAWIDYHGPIDGETVGVAMMDHPENPRHPTWWHARAYGLCAANPFGTRAFEGRGTPKGDLLVAATKSVTFRWRIHVHKGDAKAAKIDDRHRQWANVSGTEKR